VTAGYLDNPEANQAAFRGGWFHTGDLGRLDRDGFLFITGRLKEMINRGGEKILPQEVDDVLRAHPALADAAAFAVTHPTLGEEVAAAVVLRNGSAAAEIELRQFAATRLAPFKVPRRLVFVEQIPRTGTGKPQRGVLAEQFRETASPRREAATPVEGAVIEIWRRILRKEQIGTEDDFFALGGDSLAAAVMLTDVQQSLHTSGELLERVDFFDHPTVASLARIIAECGEQPEGELADPGEAGILWLRRQGSRIPFFCFPANSLHPYYLRYLAKHLGDEQPFYVLRHADPVRDGRLLPVEEVARLAIAAIRRARPQGPYLLGGHCYGGVIAFEAALQLIAQGERVEHLVLFDVPAPGSQKIRKQWKRYVAHARDLALALARGRKPITVRAVLDHARAVGHIVTRKLVGRASRALTAIGSDALLAGRGIKRLHAMAMWEYTPRACSVPISHFIAADQPVSTQLLNDPRMGWQEFARAGFAVHWLKGDHNSIFRPANAAAIAEQLKTLLRDGPLAVNPPAPLLALAAKK
jgi:thioesterase domain-containing protein